MATKPSGETLLWTAKWEKTTPETRAGCPGALPHPHQDQARQLQLPGSSSGKLKRIELTNSFVRSIKLIQYPVRTKERIKFAAWFSFPVYSLLLSLKLNALNESQWYTTPSQKAVYIWAKHSHRIAGIAKLHHSQQLARTCPWPFLPATKNSFASKQSRYSVSYQCAFPVPLRYPTPRDVEHASLFEWQSLPETSS